MTNAENVSRILDLFYEQDGREPDWAAIRTEVFLSLDPDSVLLDILKAFHAIYEIEDFAVIKTNIFVLTEDAV
jgi:hypothetical protein